MNRTILANQAAFAAVEATETHSPAASFATDDAPQALSLELLDHVAGGGPGGSWSEGPGGSW